jgi:hypothetical protein
MVTGPFGAATAGLSVTVTTMMSAAAQGAISLEISLVQSNINKLIARIGPLQRETASYKELETKLKQAAQ